MIFLYVKIQTLNFHSEKKNKVKFETTSFKGHKMRITFLSSKVNGLGDIKSTIYKNTNIYQIIKILQTTTIF